MSYVASNSRAVRFQPSMDGLDEMTDAMEEILQVRERLPLATVFTRDQLDRISNLELFCGWVADEDDRADVPRTVGFGAKLLGELEVRLDEEFEAAIATFKGSADYIRSNAPDLFLAHEGEITSVIAAFEAAVNDEDVEFCEVADKYLDVYNLLVPLQTKMREERAAAERRAETLRHQEKTDRIRTKLRKFSKMVRR